MKTYFSPYITLIFLLSSFTILSGQETNNFTDATNLQQGLWVITNATKKLPGYTADQVVEQGYYKDGKKTGKWVNYYPNGKMQHELIYINNKPDGQAIFYYPSGKIKEQGLWRNNRWVGDYKFYYENGKLRNDWQYNETGKRTGVQKYYHENGQLMIEGAWENGKESGKIVEYYEDGSVKSERFFDLAIGNPPTIKEYKKAEKPSGNVAVAAVTPKVDNTPKPVVKKSVVDSIASDETARVIIKKEDATANQKPFDGNGYYELRNKEGKIIRKGVFENGFLIDGQLFTYSPAGKQTKITHFKKGKVIKVENL